MPRTPFDEIRLQQFEAKTGVVLPSSYRKVLIELNGERPANTQFKVPGWAGGDSNVHNLFTFSNQECIDLGFWYDELHDRLPSGFLPIGVDLGGNFLCLGTAPPHAGEVYYWDASPDWDIPADEPTMFLVGRSMQEFLDGLEVPDDC